MITAVLTACVKTRLLRLSATLLRRPVLQQLFLGLTCTCLYSTYSLTVMLYRSECWTVKKADVQRINALDQWCLPRILDIHWHDFVRHDAVCRMTQQPPLSSVVKSNRLSLVGHVVRMNELADASQIMFAQLPDDWRRPQGGYAPPAFDMFATTCPHWTWTCQKPGRQLRTDDFSGGS